MSRYAAFISYSHADEKTARWLHQALETYRLPRQLVGQDSAFGPVPRKLPPVFRDRDELAASADLGENLRAALAQSRFQIILCSPKAAKSHWVNEEIITFKQLHGEARCLALIVSGEPYNDGETECFPEALRFRLDAQGKVSEQPAEPIAADLRPGKDGKRLALLKIIAGIAGVPLDGLVRRDAARRQRKLIVLATVSSCIALVTIGLAIYAEQQRRVAVRQQQLADRSLEFLIGTFAIANPATENPRTITALTILNRASRNAAAELRDEPLVSARLLRATGEIYSNLGLPKEAQRDLQTALKRQTADPNDRARILLALSWVAFKRGDAAETASLIAQASKLIDNSAGDGPELIAETTEKRGMAAILAGDYQGSANLLGQAAMLYERLPGDQRAALGRVWTNQANSLLRIKRFEEAERLFRRAETTITSLFGINHVRTAAAIQNAAVADFERGDVTGAAARVGRSIAIYERVLDSDHPTIGAALILMGRIRTAQKDYPDALAAFDRARALYARLYGSDNPAVADVDFYAADAEAGRGATDAALARLAKTKAIYDKSYGAEDPDQLELLLTRSRIQARAGRMAGARTDCAAASALHKRLNAPTAPFEDESCRRLLATR
jgi:tetratricopeptide (TPR) repeat protein